MEFKKWLELQESSLAQKSDKSKTKRAVKGKYTNKKDWNPTTQPKRMSADAKADRIDKGQAANRPDWAPVSRIYT
jgi:hypothetical protein